MSLKKSLALAALVMVATPVFASNFSYTYIEGAVGKTTLDEDLIYRNEVYEEFAAVRIGGGYQFNETFALRASSLGIANDGPNTEISEGVFTLAAVFPVALGGKLDLVPQLGIVSTWAEFCYDNLYSNATTCYTDDDSGLYYALGLRFWAVPDRFELNGGLSDSDIRGAEETIELGAAYWINKRHSVRVNYADNDLSSTYTVGYAFSW